MRTSTNLLTALVVAGAGIAGCAESTTSEPTPSTTTREILGSSPRFAIDAASVRLPLRVTWARGDWRHHAEVDLVADVGTIPITLDAAGNLIVTDLRLGLADISLAPFGQRDLTLVNAELRLQDPVTCTGTTWSDDEQYAFCDQLRVTFALNEQIQQGSERSPLIGGFVTGADLSLFVAPLDASARWLWINGDGTTKFRWGVNTVFTEIEPHLDAYNGIVQ